MMNMMHECWSWMMSFGWAGMLLGGMLFVALFVFAVIGIMKMVRS